jgi:menaquinone-dependent protoporphyrinogen IX oxidase
VKTLIASFSLTGNNTMAARHLAATLEAEHEEITAERGMGNFALALDTLLNRTPAIAAPTHDPSQYDLVVVVGPVWMGKIASPIRSYLKRRRGSFNRVAFLSVCGGALGRNPSVPEQLERILGTSPSAVTQLYISDLLPAEEQGDAKATSAYRVSEADFEDGWKPRIADFVRELKIPAG